MKESTPESEQGSTRQPTEEDERAAMSLAAVVAAAVGAVFFVHDVTPLDGWHMLSAALVAVCLAMTRAMLVIYLATVLIHELGHAAFGLAFGGALKSIRVGPWTVSRSAGAWQLRFDGKASLSLSGETVFVPRALSRRRWWWTFAGGPLANLVTGAAAAVLGWTVGLRPLRAALGILAVASLVGVGNLVPLELPSGGRTDGALMLALSRTQASTRPSELLELGRFGRRPTSNPARELYQLGSAGQRLSSGTVTPAAAHAALQEERTAAGRLLLLVRILDSNEPWRARLPLERALVQLADRPVLLSVARLHSAAYFTFVEPDLNRFRALLGHLGAGPADRFSAAVAGALRSIAEGGYPLVELAAVRQAFVDSDRARSPLYGYAWILERLWEDRGPGYARLVPRPPLPGDPGLG